MSFTSNAKFLGLLLPLLLAGCIVEDGCSKINVPWPEQRVVYVADVNVGAVVALKESDPGASVEKTKIPLHSSVRSMILDKNHSHLWVLGPRGLDVYDAHSMDLKKHIALNIPATVVSLKQDPSGIRLYSVTGAMLGRIDSHTLVASWRSGSGTMASTSQG